MASYFIVYSWVNGGNAGLGCTSATVDGGIRGFKDIEYIIESIKEQDPDLGHIVVTSWQRFEGQEAEDG
jgi:hypothetical protein